MSITETTVPPLPQVQANLDKPPSLLNPAEPMPELKQRSGFATRPPLSIIADAMKRLVWDDNERLATLICSHLEIADEHKQRMAAALQRASDDLIKEDNGSRQ